MLNDVTAQQYEQRQKRILQNDKFIHWGKIIILNEYASNNSASKYMKHKLTDLKGETDKSIIIAGFALSCLSNW